MTWISIIKNWLSVSKKYHKEILLAEYDFMKAFIERHKGINKFDLITIAQVFRLAYCLGKNSKK